MEREATTLVLGLLSQIAKRDYTAQRNLYPLLQILVLEEESRSEESPRRVVFDTDGYPQAGPLGEDACGTLLRRGNLN